LEEETGVKFQMTSNLDKSDEKILLFSQDIWKYPAIIHGIISAITLTLHMPKDEAL